jgi:hypothetical protein
LKKKHRRDRAQLVLERSRGGALIGRLVGGAIHPYCFKHLRIR